MLENTSKINYVYFRGGALPNFTVIQKNREKVRKSKRNRTVFSKTPKLHQLFGCIYFVLNQKITILIKLILIYLFYKYF